MRAVAIGILALLAGGCAPAPGFDLVARDPEAPWLAGQHWVRTESSRSTVNTSFIHTFADHLIFEVEVVNQSDTTLAVDPAAFSYTLSSSGELPAKLKKSFAALEPEAAVTQARKAIDHASDVGTLTMAVAGLVVITAAVLSVVEFGAMPDVQVDGAATGGNQVALYGGDAREDPMVDPRQVCERSVEGLLHLTALAPGESVRGELWLPAWPVRRALGSDHPGDPSSITATPSAPAAGFGLTLHAPSNLGSQAIEYGLCW